MKKLFLIFQLIISMNTIFWVIILWPLIYLLTDAYFQYTLKTTLIQNLDERQQKLETYNSKSFKNHNI